MTKNSPQIKYVVDTSILIAFSRWIPIELNKSFWDKLESLLKEGRWILLDIVVGEITHGSIKEWCKKQKVNGLITAITDNDRELGIRLMRIMK